MMMEDSGPSVISGGVVRECAGHPSRFFHVSAIEDGPHDTARDEKNPRCADRRKRPSWPRATAVMGRRNVNQIRDFAGCRIN